MARGSDRRGLRTGTVAPWPGRPAGCRWHPPSRPGTPQPARPASPSLPLGARAASDARGPRRTAAPPPWGAGDDNAGGHPQRRRGPGRGRTATGATWLHVRLAGAPQRHHGMGPAARARRSSGRSTDPHRGGPRPAPADVLPRRAAGASRAGRRRAAARPTPRRRVLHPQQAHPLPQRRVRAGGLRHQRALPDCNRLARRRLRRHPRHRPPGPRAGPGLARHASGCATPTSSSSRSACRSALH